MASMNISLVSAGKSVWFLGVRDEDTFGNGGRGACLVPDVFDFAVERFGIVAGRGQGFGVVAGGWRIVADPGTVSKYLFKVCHEKHDYIYPVQTIRLYH